MPWPARCSARSSASGYSPCCNPCSPTPPSPSPPTAWRVVPLLAGIVLFIVGLRLTSANSISAPAFPGLIVTLIGLVVGGPWLTAQAARAFARFMQGGSALLAARRLADNPKAAFRSVSGLVLAVFLGTVVAGLLPAVDSLTATPSATALSNVLLDGFLAAPVCGNNVNCTGGSGPAGPETGSSPLRERMALEGLPPQDANPSNFGPIGPGAGASGPPNNAVISCAGLRELAALGQCPAGRKAVKVFTGDMIYSDNPHYSTKPIASPSSPAASDNFSGLYLQAVLVKVSSSATL